MSPLSGSFLNHSREFKNFNSNTSKREQQLIDLSNRLEDLKNKKIEEDNTKLTAFSGTAEKIEVFKSPQIAISNIDIHHKMEPAPSPSNQLNLEEAIKKHNQDKLNIKFSNDVVSCKSDNVISESRSKEIEAEKAVADSGFENKRDKLFKNLDRLIANRSQPEFKTFKSKKVMALVKLLQDHILSKIFITI